MLRAREAMNASVRAFFRREGFVEVSTPLVLSCPNLDPNILPVPVTLRDFSGRPQRFWLHTSPELSMKKLLASGSGSIFQISKVFRDEEMTALHRWEFSMLEWYRVGADYRDAMRDTKGVIREVCRLEGGEGKIRWDGVTYDLDGPWETLTLAEAFARYAGVGSFDRGEMTEALGSRGYLSTDDDRDEDLFFRIYLDHVEPNLGRDRPTFVTDYPAFLGTMAKPREDDPGFLERFEVFIGGVELANGYSEMTDVADLRGRMEKVRSDLAKGGIEGLTIDEGFLDAVGQMPRCAGVSVGMDRLAMIALDAKDISQVVYPFKGVTT